MRIFVAGECEHFSFGLIRCVNEKHFALVGSMACLIFGYFEHFLIAADLSEMDASI